MHFFRTIKTGKGLRVMVSPLVFSNNFIKRALETGVPMSPMKLQKLLYLLYARYYARYNIQIFANRFEKWPYGPVVSDVYVAFKGFEDKQITTLYRDVSGNVTVADENNPEFSQCFDEVWSRYGLYSGIQLSSLTHQPGSAWRSAPEMGNFLRSEDIKADGRRFFK